MAEIMYESPEINVVGNITEITQGAKPGIYFDFPGSSRRVSTPPPPSTPGTIS
jgi:hypothetical protein